MIWKLKDVVNCEMLSGELYQALAASVDVAVGQAQTSTVKRGNAVENHRSGGKATAEIHRGDRRADSVGRRWKRCY